MTNDYEPYPNLIVGGIGYGVLERQKDWDLLIILVGNEDIQRHFNKNIELPNLVDKEYIILQWQDDEANDTLPKINNYLEAKGIADIIVNRIKLGQKVLVTCGGGNNRSGLVTALAIKKLTGYPAQRIINKIRILRNTALNNEKFIKKIKEY